MAKFSQEQLRENIIVTHTSFFPLNGFCFADKDNGIFDTQSAKNIHWTKNVIVNAKIYLQ